MISQSSESPWSQETIARRKTTIQAKSWSKSPLQQSDSDFNSIYNPNTKYQGEDANADHDSITGSEVMRDSYLNARKTNLKHNPRHNNLVSITMQTTKTILVAGLQSVTGTLDLSCSTSSKV